METVERVAFTVEEAAQSLGVSKATIYDLIHSDGFPVLRIGRRTLISVEGLKQWVLRQAGVQDES